MGCPRCIEGARPLLLSRAIMCFDFYDQVVVFARSVQQSVSLPSPRRLPYALTVDVTF